MPICLSTYIRVEPSWPLRLKPSPQIVTYVPPSRDPLLALTAVIVCALAVAKSEPNAASQVLRFLVILYNDAFKPIKINEYCNEGRDG